MITRSTEYDGQKEVFNIGIVYWKSGEGWKVCHAVHKV